MNVELNLVVVVPSRWQAEYLSRKQSCAEEIYAVAERAVEQHKEQEKAQLEAAIAQARRRRGATVDEPVGRKSQQTG